MKNKMKGKIVIPTYRMDTGGFYLLLRVRMEKRGCHNINGVGEAFFKPETYRDGSGILAKLCKRDILSEQQGNIMLREGLEKALDIMLDSPHCMNFQNAMLQKNGQVLSFYYANGAYVGVLMGQKNSMLVMAAEEDALYKAFGKQMEDTMVSSAFQPELWNALWRGGGVSKPRREAGITHSGNRVWRERFYTAMIADNRQIQLIRGADSLSSEQLNRETAAVGDWYGVICRELERLKVENQGRGADRNVKKEIHQERSEYQKVTETPGFPQSRAGFVLWSLKRVAVGLPRMLWGMLHRRSLALLLYPLWGVFLFLYNMYMTCVFNDTFMLDRRARLGNLTPYLMAGTLQTPSSLKGLQMDWGLIDTSFLAGSLMMVLTLLLRHVVLQLWHRKTGFFSDLATIPAGARDCAAQTEDRRKVMWVVFALVWVLGFLVMNPVTIFLAALLLLFMFAQGGGNPLAQLMFLWACAAGRRKIDAGKKTEPDSRKYRLMLFYGSLGLTVYGLASVVLWFVAGYNWWVRLVLTVLMVLFAMLQAFMPEIFSGKFHSGTSGMAVFFLLCLTTVCVAVVVGNNMGVVFADDGGWSESGRTLSGLLMNAGFGIILGVSLLTIGLWVGLPLAVVAIGSLAAGVGTAVVGLTDTVAGEYVRKSSKQYFLGVEEGESKTLFCTATEFLNFVSGFANPGTQTGTALKVFRGGRLAGDLVPLANDLVHTAADMESIRSRTDGNFANISIGETVTLVTDCIGLAEDFEGMFDHWEALSQIGNPSFWEQCRDIQDSRRNEIEGMRNNLNARRQAEISAADAVNSDTVMQIYDRYEREIQEKEREIVKKYSQEKRKLLQDTILEQVYEDNKVNWDGIKDTWDELQEIFSINENFQEFIQKRNLDQTYKEFQEGIRNSETYQIYEQMQEWLEEVSDTEMEQLWKQVTGHGEGGLATDEN